MLYVKKPAELKGSFNLEEATLKDYVAIIPNEIKLKLAEMYLYDCVKQGDAYTSTDMTKKYIATKIAMKDREVFGVLVLDSQHRLITDEIVVEGTINAASVYPREVLKIILQNGGAAAIFYHNHPSGCPTPSEADKRLTTSLKEALSLIDCRVLDHIIVGVEGQYSFVENSVLI